MITTTWAQRAFHDFIFQACSSGWKTKRNPTRVQSIPELLYVGGFCRVVISLWIHQLLPQRQIYCWSIPWPPQGDEDKRQGDKGEDEEEDEQKAAAMIELRISSTWPAVTQTSALILRSTSRWSEESYNSSLSRQTYDVDSGGISLTDWSWMLTLQ